MYRFGGYHHCIQPFHSRVRPMPFSVRASDRKLAELVALNLEPAARVIEVQHKLARAPLHKPQRRSGGDDRLSIVTGERRERQPFADRLLSFG